MTYYLHQPNSKPRQLRGWWIVLAAVTCSFSIAGLGYGIANALGNQTSAVQPVSLDRKLLIYEIKQGRNTNPSEQVQFVTIYNPNDTAVDVQNWSLEYVKTGFEAAFCSAAEWRLHTASVTAKRRIIGSSGADAANIVTIPAHQLSGQIPLDINDNLAGSIHLVDRAGTVHDMVGWGRTSTSSTDATCNETSQAADLSTADSLVRFMDCDGLTPVDSNNNANDFYITATLSLGTYGNTKLPLCTPPEPPIIPPTEQEEPDSPSVLPVTTRPAPQASATCQNVVISELLANPAGSDVGHEYIELHNTSDELINLQGCSLQTSASNTKKYTFGDTNLPAGGYLAVYDTQTGLTLPNASGGSVWLLNASDELQTVMYPANPEDDSSWSLADGNWGRSYSLTPNNFNIQLASKPCPDGQIRNIESSRCITKSTMTPSMASTASISSATGLAACNSGQVRNPETNRCRNITAANTTTVACPAGQSRNPETNRCRAITATDTAPTACKEGQVRNPETNRCRKITAAGSTDGSGLSGVQDVSTDKQAAAKPYWLLAAVALVAAIAYGIYEWRQEIATGISKLLRRAKPVTQL